MQYSKDPIIGISHNRGKILNVVLMKTAVFNQKQREETCEQAGSSLENHLHCQNFLLIIKWNHYYKKYLVEKSTGVSVSEYFH